ncbi:MAG: Uma2 family endonuclease [Pyrinomonadaceae bacterium]|nr:Uma2 family endonuclease [Pyrinomonadaceae bacterium]
MPKKKIYTPEEYLALEEKAEYRSEYDNGEIIAMAGGSLKHLRIISNLTRYVGNRLSNDCEVLPTELKVWVEPFNRFYYPDLVVLCGEPNFYRERNDTVTIPIAIIEVLSTSTEAKDRGEKFFAYQSLESVQEYILVSQNRPIVERFTKQKDGSWRYRATIGFESFINIEVLDVRLTLGEIYQRIDFEEENL